MKRSRARRARWRALLARRLRREGRARRRRQPRQARAVHARARLLPQRRPRRIYAAQASGEYRKAGLDVQIKVPPDPAAPLKLLRAGKADAVISYEPELLLARDQGARNLIGVGALVQTPLTILMSIGSSKVRSPKDLAGKRVATAGIPYQSAYLKTILAKAGRRPRLGQGDQRRLQPRAGDALQEGRRDARRVLELRGRRPAPARPRPADLPDGGPRRPDLRRADLRRPPPGPRRGSAPRSCAASSRPPRAGTSCCARTRRWASTPCSKANHDLDRKLQEASVKETLPVVLPRGPRAARSAGRTRTPGRAYARWMFENKLLKRPPAPARAVHERVPAGRGARAGPDG